uniref:NADH-ubiquinone oxidoreductase chain 2 n=1 Tax=Ramisyllis multicaudata TaxID=1166726 RepID=A0A0K0YD50_RAMMU|nr:NADH dehydrogenase subunit 2 [Ramisyllis multicaudata]AKS48911.1 NADH dehydrogenase subunit 2 [Ramisyllis multicaudata]
MLLMSTLILSTIMIVSSSSWLFVWVGFEINLMSFLPLMMSSHSSKEMSSCIMYFLVQAISSPVLLLSALALMHLTYAINMNPIINNSPYLLLLMSLMMKLGGSPCHYWLPKVMNNLTWPMLSILSIWQKIPALAIISCLSTKWMPMVMYSLVIMNAAVGGAGGINQTHLRPLLAYSSIMHLSWMLMAMLMSSTLPPIYFTMYSTILLSLVIILAMSNKMSINQFNSMFNSPHSSMLIMFLTMLSLAGMPPLTGFMPKIMVLNSTILWHPWLALTLIILSLLSLYYYLTLFMGAFLSSFKSIKSTPPYPFLTLMIILSTSALPLMLVF